MTPDDELAALGRIIDTIKIYRQQTSDFQAVENNSAVKAYLKQYLSGADWLLWQRLQTEGNLDPLFSTESPEVAGREANLLMGRYKRASYEFIQGLDQSTK